MMKIIRTLNTSSNSFKYLGSFQLQITWQNHSLAKYLITGIITKDRDRSIRSILPRVSFYQLIQALCNTPISDATEMLCKTRGVHPFIIKIWDR